MLWLVFGPGRIVLANDSAQHLLYVALPGIRDELGHGGHGILVFDIDGGHRFFRRIAAAGLDGSGKPLPVRGIAANASTGRLYVSTTATLASYDLASDKLIWERGYKDGCDRMSLTPDGRTMFLPNDAGTYWHVLDAVSGDEVDQIVTHSGAHNTVVGPDGQEVYLAGLHSPLLTVADVRSHHILRTVGPFSAEIRPFTVDREHCFVCVNGLLGFEIGDLHSGRKLFRIEVQGFKTGPTARHGCPSHGIGMTPDGREVWVCDSFNRRLHVFDATTLPPRQVASIPTRDEPGWITFSLDGRFAYPSTGDVIDVQARKPIASLTDEHGQAVASEKLLEIDFGAGKPIAAGNQFGVGNSPR